MLFLGSLEIVNIKLNGIMCLKAKILKTKMSENERVHGVILEKMNQKQGNKKYIIKMGSISSSDFKYSSSILH